MTRAGVLAAAVAADLLLWPLPVGASPAPEHGPPVSEGRPGATAADLTAADPTAADPTAADATATDPTAADATATDPEQPALALLRAASRAGRDLTYTGRQVLVWADDQPGSAQARVHHDPVHGSTVAAARPLVVTAAPDQRRLVLLAAAYDLAVTGPGRCTGRSAEVVSATRADGTLAGRFWIDRRSGLLLRRDVFDRAGSRVRSSAYVDVAVGAPAGAPAAPPAGGPASGPDEVLPQASTLAALRQDGWRVPTTLPGGFRLFDTQQSTPRPGRPVLHLAYSDGISSVSLFAQRGGLGSAPVPGFVAETVGTRPVWLRGDGPQRAMWGGDGRVWTLVSDAPTASVRDVVAALPGDAAPSPGLRGRLGRGLARLGGMLNPFS